MQLLITLILIAALRMPPELYVIAIIWSVTSAYMDRATIKAAIKEALNDK